MYAILSHGGRQYRVSAGDRLVVDRLDAEVGSVVALAPVLLTGGDGKTALGKDLDGLRVAVTVVAHRRGEKLRIFKYKAKKRSRKVAGYRSDLTELRVESILAKGAALPRPTAATVSRADAATAAEKPAARAPRATRSAPAAEAPVTAPVQPARTPRPSKPAAVTTSPGAAKRASTPSAKPKATSGTAKPAPKAVAQPKTKAAGKRTTKSGPAAGAKEKGNGA
jgi:large subunit ribosomal protein L21